MPSKTVGGRIVKSQRKKKPIQQQHQKNHRWESFSSKIAKLHSLDPLHKVRRHDLDEASANDLSATTSYFRNGLEKWADLNLTRGFTAFRRAVQPLCESLAQILHFEDRIMDALAAAIQEAGQAGDDGREALEPLLDLLTAFAHDLGSRFVQRGYDARAFALLVDVARRNSGAGLAAGGPHRQQNHELDAAVIEWTFACLAFLFKYLARLLVPDLRSTFDILAPLLGRPSLPNPARHVPGHIARFTAEALSFLVRVTANKTRREKELTRIVHHIRDDLLQVIEAAASCSTKHTRTSKDAVQLYTQGIMTLFAEATKGPGDTLRLSADGIFLGILQAIPKSELELKSGGNKNQETPWSDICCGVLTSMIHHASSEQLQPIIDAILAEAALAVKNIAKGPSSKGVKTQTLTSSDLWRLSIYVRLIGVLAGVRDGAKVKDWSSLVKAILQILEAISSGVNIFSPVDSSYSLIWQHILANVAIVWHHAPLSTLTPQLASLLKSLAREPFTHWFIPFCASVAELNPLAFQSTLREPFQAYISAHWSYNSNEDILCTVLVNMAVAGAFPLVPTTVSSSNTSNNSKNKDCLRLPQSWQDSIVSKFEQLEAIPFPERGDYGKDPTTWREHCLPKYAALLHLVDTVAIVHPSTPARIAQLLLRKLKLALRPTSTQLANNDETTFLVTQGFRSYLRMTRALAETPDAGLRPLLRAAAPRFARRVGFLEALLQYERQVQEVPPTAEDTGRRRAEAEEGEKEEDPFVKALVANLAAPSHQLRLVSLQLLKLLGDADMSTSPPDHAAALDNMLQTEQLDFSPQNVRIIAVHLRKLAQLYAHVAANSWLQAAIPAFLFGMLSVPLAPVWDDAIKAMKQVAETNKAGEEAIATLALDWVDVSSFSSGENGSQPKNTSDSNNSGPRLPPTDFECFKFDRLMDTARRAEKLTSDPTSRLWETFQEKQQAVAAHANFARSKALKVLAAMPAVAEKRSRRLVPHLLSWTEDQLGPRASDGDDNAEDESDAEDEEYNDDDVFEKEDNDGSNIFGEGDLGELGGWSFSDKKALVVVFSLFTNSQVLYQSDKAYAALLRLMANGDTEIQRLALKSLLAWRQDALIRYKEQLNNLLDETKFKNELALLLQADDEDRSNTGILPEHRADLMPVLLRLLYGRTISKKGAASGRQGLHATRLFVIRNLDVDGIGGFLGVALGNLQGIRVVTSGAGKPWTLRESIFPESGDENGEGLLTARKQVGMLNMLEPIITELGTNVTPFLDVLVNATLYCLVCACRGLQSVTATARSQHDNDGEEDQVDAGPVTGSGGNTSLLRTAKTAALRCLCALFRNAGDFDWEPYRDVIIGEVISPSIDRLPQETTQGVSWTWKLLATWAQLPQCVMFLDVDKRIVPKILESLSTKRAKDVIKIFALGVLDNLVQLSQAPAAESPFHARILSELLTPNMDAALLHLNRMLRSSTTEDGGGEISRPLLEACVNSVVALSPLVQASTHVRSLVDIATWLLNQPSRRVNPRVKGSLLLILERFIRLDGGASDDKSHQDQSEEDKELRRKVFATIASLFSFFMDRENRQSLCRVLAVFATAQTSSTAHQQQLQSVADLCFDLNSYVEGQLDEPDYDRRLAAFSIIVKRSSASHSSEPPFTVDQWLPLLHNMLFYIRVDEEYGILASNAADGFCKFIDDVTDSTTQQPKDEDENGSAGLVDMLKSLVLPAMYSGARNASETVRRETARVFGHLIANLRAWQPVADLAPLVPEQKKGAANVPDQEEANMEDAGTVEDDKDINRAFFSNILNPAISKQIQAMQVLEGINGRYPLSSKNISQFFIPLLEHFIFGREEGADDFGLGAQATNTIAQLAYSLEWNQYRALLRRFLSFIETKPELQKQVVRLLDKVVDTLYVSAGKKASNDIAGGDAESKTNDAAVAVPQRRLAATLPDMEKLSDEILNNLTPSLFEYLHDKDEETVSARVPVAIVVVKLLNLLPSQTRDQKLAGVLTDVCHILRSKAWESREMARETLARIACILGPSCFGFILQELRGALTRGYQLHVLSYTMHTLLLAVIPQFAQGDLDDCVETMMTIIMDDVFGAVGEEKDAEGYVSKMKEVKKSKSQDSLKLVAKNVSIRHLGHLVRPLHDLMLEKITKTIAAKIDTLLSQIAAGLAQNPAVAESRDTLVFCYEIINDVYKSRAAADTQGGDARKMDPRIKKFLFQKTMRNNTGARTAGKFTYKLIQFALDLLRTVLRQHDNLRTAENIAGFVPIIGDAVVAGEDEVKIAAYKLLVVLVKVSFQDMKKFTGLYQVCTKEAIKTVQTAAATTSDLAQAALKLISVVLRSRHEDIPVRANAVDELLGKLKHDLTDPLYRHVTFNFVRAVLDRKVESAAVYDTLDYIGTVMITNDDQETRDLARRAFFQFLREYPQRRRRWERQLAFIVAQFDYDRESGRLSALEVVYQLLLKATAPLASSAEAADDPFVQDIVAASFLPLVLVLARDASAKCRRVAAAQLQAMLQMAKREYLNEFLRMFREWMAADEAANGAEGLGKLNMGVEMFGLYFASWDSKATPVTSATALTTTQAADLRAVVDRLAALLGSEAVRRTTVHDRLIVTCLQTAEVLVTNFPVLALDPEAAEDLWRGVRQCLWHSTHDVRMAAMRLVGLYLADFSGKSLVPTSTAANGSKKGNKGQTADSESAITGSYGMKLGDEDVATFVRGCLSVLSARGSEDVDEVEAGEAAKMLVHLGQYLRPEPEDEEEKEEKDEEDEDEEEEEEEDQGEEEEDDEEEEEDNTLARARPIDRRYVFLRLARIVRREAPPRASALVPKAAAMTVLEAFCSTKQKGGAATAAAAAPPSAVAARAVLRPLRNLTDTSIPAPIAADPNFAARYDDLKRRAQQLMDVIQQRLGTAQYTRLLLAVGSAARDRRQQRASKRKIAAVAQPERHGRDKRKKLERQKERRKVRGQEHRGVRRGY